MCPYSCPGMSHLKILHISFDKFLYFPFIAVLYPSYIAVDFIFDVNICMFLEPVTDPICTSLPSCVRVELHSVCIHVHHTNRVRAFTHDFVHVSIKRMGSSAGHFSLLYLPNKVLMNVNSYLFVIALSHVCMFIHHP
jgi:hypothetical protein